MATLFIDPGALRSELSLQAVTAVADGLGGFSEEWSEVATVFARQQFGDGAGFAMPPHAKHDALVGPFHKLPDYRIPALRAAGGIAALTRPISRTSPAHRR